MPNPYLEAAPANPYLADEGNPYLEPVDAQGRSLKLTPDQRRMMGEPGMNYGPEEVMTATRPGQREHAYTPEELAALPPPLTIPQLAGKAFEPYLDLRVAPLTPFPRVPSKAEQVLAGVLNVATKPLEFLSSPGGAATLGTGALPGSVGRLVAGGFAADMARHLPEQAVDVYGAFKLDEPLQRKIETVGDLGVSTAFTTAATRHAATRQLTRAEMLARELDRAPLEAPRFREGNEPLVRSVEARGNPYLEEPLTAEPAPAAPLFNPDFVDIHQAARRAARWVPRSLDTTSPPREATPAGQPDSVMRRQWDAAYHDEVAKIEAELDAMRKLAPSPLLSSEKELTIPPAPPETTTVIDPRAVPVSEVPVAKLKLSKDVPNFKEEADADTGVVRGQQLEGSYERLGTAPIVVWERLDGSLEVITGRHRLDLARRSGEQTIPAQVVREAGGFTKDHALTFDAEANIRDGQGSVRDYAHYFRNSQQRLTRPEAAARGLLSRAKGQAGFDLGQSATDDLYALYAAEKVGEGQALAIARAAPGNAEAQRIGAKYALAGKPAEFVGNLVKAAVAETGGRAEALDLFGSNDAALQQMEVRAERAGAIQKSISEQIRAVQGAANRPEVAARLGVDVRDPDGARKAVTALKAELDRWSNWPLHPDLVERVKGVAAGSEGAGKRESVKTGVGKLRDEILAAPSLEALDALAGRADAQETLRAASPTDAQWLREAMDIRSNELAKVKPAPPLELAPPESVEQQAAFEQLQSVSNKADRRPYRPLSAEQMERLVASGDVHGRGPKKGRLTEQGQSALLEFKRQERVAANEEYQKVLREEADQPLTLAAPETIAQQQARLSVEERANAERETRNAEQERAATAQREMLERAAAPIGGDLGSAGQGGLFVEPGQQEIFRPTAPGGAASTSRPTPDFPRLPGTVPGGLDAIRPMETPEILRLANEITTSPAAVANLRTAWGRFYGEGPRGRIKIDRNLFADPNAVASTLAHELGHANDFFPEGTLKRGNLIGRLVGSVHQFLKGSFGELKDAELRTELKDLSAFWRPWDEAAASDSFKKYRNSAKELYADAISVLLNSPGLLEQRAPKFYKAFFEHLDKKPSFKEEFFALQDVLMRGPEAVLDRRLGQSREAFEKGEAMLHEKLTLRDAARNSFKDFLTKVRIQSIDMASHARRLLGSKDPRTGSRFDELYEEWKLDDNKNAGDVKRIYHEMIVPLTKLGLDEHSFGQVLELQRIMGGIDAYRDMQALRQALGPDKMDVLKQAETMLADLERQGLADELGGSVQAMLDKIGLDMEFIDRYRQLRETQGTRAELANPQGRSPLLAQAELARLLDTMTSGQRVGVLESARRFRELIFERATEARDVGIVNALTFDKTIVPNKDNYAAFRPLDKIEPYVTPMVRRARGTLSDLENPFITTLLKLQSLNNLIEVQRLKNLVRDEMTKLFPDQFTKAETRWTGRRREAVPPKPDQGRVKILENGRLVEYNTDPYIAKVFERVVPTDAHWMNKLLEVPFRLGVYPLIIKYNPGFLFAFNPRRDMARTIRNLYAVEGVTRRELLPNYASPETLRAVNDYLQGRPNPLADAMIKSKAITPSWQGFARIEQQDVMTDLLRRYRQAAKPQQNALVRGLMWLPEKINQGGSFLEALPKFAAYRTLIERGVGPERAAFLVRNYVGTPNFKVKGEWANVQNSWRPFLNIFLQGWRSDLKLATNPRTASGWWFQWALQHGWQAVLVGLVTAGVFGEELKRLFGGISEYDRANYGVIPIGTRTGGEFGEKTVYLRMPRDETSRFFSALTYKATRALADKAMGNVDRPQGVGTEAFAFGAGVTPSPSPMLEVASAWKEYLSGRNPIDPFRNQPVIGPREFKAGGAEASKDMVRWTLQQSGLLNLIRWDHRAETTTELAVSGTPVINRLVKVSDQGHRERQRDSETIDAQARARFRMGYSDDVQSVLAQEHFLQQLGPAKRTPQQEQRYWQLHVWKTAFYDPSDAAAWNAREDKADARRTIQSVNTSAKELVGRLNAKPR